MRHPFTRSTPPAPRVVLAFCRSCNARERVIDRGRCVVCGRPPAEAPSELADAGETELEAMRAEALLARSVGPSYDVLDSETGAAVAAGIGHRGALAALDAYEATQRKPAHLRPSVGAAA